MAISANISISEGNMTRTLSGPTSDWALLTLSANVATQIANARAETIVTNIMTPSNIRAIGVGARPKDIMSTSFIPAAPIMELV